jgi:integrase
MGEHAATRAMGRARPKLGIANIRVHDLRKTAATGMAKLGISPHTISLVLNHASARTGTVTLEHYINLYSYDGEKRHALLAWGEQLRSVIGPTQS